MIFTISLVPRTVPNTKEAVDKYLFNGWKDGGMDEFTEFTSNDSRGGKLQQRSRIMRKAENMTCALLKICGINK